MEMAPMAYIDMVCRFIDARQGDRESHVIRHYLTDIELHEIGDFTRENVSTWLERHKGPDWVGILPVLDFHAVCGSTDIPLATEEAKKQQHHG